MKAIITPPIWQYGIKIHDPNKPIEEAKQVLYVIARISDPASIRLDMAWLCTPSVHISHILNQGIKYK